MEKLGVGVLVGRGRTIETTWLEGRIGGWSLEDRGVVSVLWCQDQSQGCSRGLGIAGWSQICSSDGV
eukprot:750063-Hanusia_phi.AAC.1